MNAKNDLLLFLFVLLVLGVIWFVNGGPSRFSSTEPFLSPPAPLGSGGTYGSGSSGQGGFFSFITSGGGVQKTPGATSSYSENVSLEQGSAGASKPGEEYLRLRAVGASVNITGWKLRSRTSGNAVTIGKGAALAYSAQVNYESDIILKSGDEALLTSGRSPVGVSFRTNICSGYFEQFQDFTPPLFSNCPLPRDELSLVGPNNLSDSCINVIESMPPCRMEISPPTDISPECSAFIIDKINYSQCVLNHKSDADFAGTEWRVFLNQDKELWKERRETIDLIDRSGTIVSTLTY
ncbi:MAG TPA: hypothetical protein VJI74_00220 [Candidatus Paceibacterota bacterium]